VSDVKPENACRDAAGVSVFLSYSRDDRERVRPIIDALTAQGYDVWWDGLLKGGDRFSQVTETALETADAVLVVWTSQSIDSHWVRDEATRGRDRGRLLSLSFDNTQPPLGFRQIQFIDLSKWNGDAQGPGFAEVLHALDSIRGTDGTGLTFAGRETGDPDGRTGMSRRAALLLGGGGLLVIGGGFAAWQAGLLSDALPSNSIAVMSFENLSNDPDQDYFSAGLSEELRTTLSLNRQLSVAAQTSSDKFAGNEETAGAIADALGVAFILEGSVRRSADRLRITTRLINGATDFEEWSDVFDRELDNVLSVQTEIATTVVDALIANFAKNSAAGTVRIGGTDNPDALDPYLRGVALYGQASGVEAIDRQALAALEDAIARDPDYAAAHAARSRVLTAIGNSYASGKELSGYYRRAMEAARKAVELAPDLAEGHSALGFVLTNGTLDIAAARQPYDRSFELGYGNADILRGFALFASFIGSFDKGRTAIERAQRLDSLNGSVTRASAVLEFAARDYNKAAAAARQTLALNDKASVVNRIMGDIARFEKRLDEARSFYLAETSLLSRLPALAILEAQLSNLQAAEKVFDQMVAEFGDNSLYQQAQVLAQWGRFDDALDSLDRAFDVGDSGLVLSRSDQNLDPVRHTPRFKALQSRLGFT
jgi:TolB-like protein/Flp pilus assembly protein TadD